ncbi:MAG: 50S ribosomal protein L9 [Candidatus Marinamargulisbacteria bacterium]|nr:50S ribosomal protein L9 [bacterium]MDG2264637.1 50S ribosomal protein L9 [Candidatus Marinamargulisbacteria bacterium]
MGKQVSVILVEAIPGLGEFGDEKKVKAGYANNWLIPQGLVELVNARNSNLVQDVQKKKTRYETQKTEDAQSLKKQLDSQSVTISVAVNDNGDLYGSVGPKELCAAIQNDLAVTISKECIPRTFLLTALGEHEVSIPLFGTVSATLTVSVNQA